MITVTPIYSYNGDECRGASRLFTISVNPRPKMELVGNGIVCHNGTVASILLNTPASIGTMSYQWNNDNTAIGLASAGNGNIPAFTALNTDTTVQIATITVLAFQTLNGLTCQTDSQQFTISVNPVATMVSINNSTVCAGAIVSSIDFSSNVSSQAVRYDWHNNDTTIGLSARGSGAIPSFTATNNGQNPIIATITVTPYITTNGLDCAGNTINFTITVNPQVAMEIGRAHV